MKTKAPQSEWVETLKALADSSRLRIIRELLDGPANVGDLAQRTGLSNYNTSKHLRVLRSVGIVQGNRLGTVRLYAIAEGFRRRINHEQVLDLGCCVFRLGQLED